MAMMMMAPCTAPTRNSETKFDSTMMLATSSRMIAPTTVPQTRPMPPLQRRAADHDGGDRLQLPQEPGGRRRGAEARHVDEHGDADADPLDHVGERADAPDRHARIARHVLVGAERDDVAPEGRLVEDQRGDGGDRQKHDDRDGDAEEIAEIDRAVEFAQFEIAHGDRAAGGEEDHQRPEDSHRAERHDEGLDAPEGDDEPVGEAAGRAQRERDQQAERERARIGRAEAVERQDHHAGR